MKPIILPQHYNYIGVFLTLNCNLGCPYCLNTQNGGRRERRHLSPSEWIKGLNRLISRPDLPVSLQGGEPSIYEGFFDVIQGIKPELKIDILTNLSFNINEFIKKIPPQRINRVAPYAPIRVSYHAWKMNLEELTKKILALMKAGFRVGLYGLEYPEYKEKNEKAKKICADLGIDFRIKEFLGYYKGKLYGTYKYKDACVGWVTKKRVWCKTTELLIAPDGKIFRCHRDLYNNENPIGHILDEDFEIKDVFRSCNYYGCCNPCDVKLKTNRFQIFGHCSVEIREENPYE